jgi:hypothetical protein
MREEAPPTSSAAAIVAMRPSTFAQNPGVAAPKKSASRT